MALPRDLVSEVLNLPEEQRAELVDVLLESIGTGSDCDLSAEELAEIDEGFAEIDRGEAIAAESILEQARQIR